MHTLAEERKTVFYKELNKLGIYLEEHQKDKSDLMKKLVMIKEGLRWMGADPSYGSDNHKVFHLLAKEQYDLGKMIDEAIYLLDPNEENKKAIGQCVCTEFTCTCGG